MLTCCAGKAKFLSTMERSMACWFLCSGLIHLIIEGRGLGLGCLCVPCSKSSSRTSVVLHRVVLQLGPWEQAQSHGGKQSSSMH